MIGVYLPRDSLYEMALFATTRPEFCLKIYCHEARKESSGTLLKRALQERIPLEAFGYLLELCPKNELTSVAPLVRKAGDNHANNVFLFDHTVPRSSKYKMSHFGNLNSACVYPHRRPSAWLNPIDMAAASGECLSSSSASFRWFEPFGRSGNRCLYGVY
jgi:hypothetical protein